MSLQFIMGPSGSGKSHSLYQWVTKESMKHPDKKYIVLVPEQFTMQTQKDLVLASPRKGILNVEVLSFHRLAQRVFEETGEGQKTILNEVGKNFVIRKIASEQEENLKLIGGNLRKIGYISEVKSVISEFTQYDIQPEVLDEMMEKVKDNATLYYKLHDLRILYENFRAYLQEKYITGEEVLNVLSSVASKSKLLNGSVIVLDGFTGFTPVQNKLLGQLMQLCEDVVVSVTMDKREDLSDYDNPYQLFALSKQMIHKLKGLAEEQGIPLKETITLYNESVYRFRENEAMAFLESNLFRYSKKVFEKEQDSIRIWYAKNPKEEVDFVAQKVRQLVRTGGCRYQDIAILSSGLDDYANLVERIFDGYQIPYFLDHKRSILLNSFVEYLRSLLVMVEQNFSYDSVFRYLRTDFVGLTVEEVDVLENYVLAFGIRGFKKWDEQWVRKTKNMTVEDLQQINDIRERFLLEIASVVPALKSKKKTVYDITNALHSYFLERELQKQIQECQKQFEADGDLGLAKEYAQVYRIVIELFEQFVELLGDEPVSLKEYCELLDAGLEEAKVGVIPPSVDQVVIGDVERSRIKDVKVVFLLGASDKYIPSSSGKKGILSEYDRQLITNDKQRLAPSEKEKAYIQKFYLYLMLTKPEQHLYLTFSTNSDDGKEVYASYLVSELIKMFAKLNRQPVPTGIRDKEFSEETAINALVEGLQKKELGLSAEWKELYSWYKRQGKWNDKLEGLLDAAFYQKPSNMLSTETAQKLYGKILKNSVTRLEKYSQCAYAHFLSHGLKLKERELFEFSDVDFGDLLHNALKKFGEKLQKNKWTWTTYPKEQEETLIQESVDESISEYDSSVLYDSFKNEYIIVRLISVLKRSIWALRKQLEKGDFVPEGYEVSFNGSSGLSMSKVSIGTLGELHLEGKIDRIDICREDCTDNVYVKIVDYKSSARTLQWNKLCHGLQLQLLLYLNVALEIEKKKDATKAVIPAGVFYSPVMEPIVKKCKDQTDVEEAIFEKLRPNGLVQSDEKVLDLLDKDAVSVDEKGDTSLTTEEFSLVLEHVDYQVQRIGKEIFEGQAEISPYKIGEKTGCTYCQYKEICGIQEKSFRYQYREIEEMSKEDALEKMRKEVDEWK